MHTADVACFPVSNAIFALGLALLGCASDAAWLFGSWLVLGVAMSCGLYESAFATVARIYGQDARRAITGITLIAGFASTIAWPLTAWMEVSFGWRFACFAWSAAHLLICAPLNLLVPAGGRIVGATSEAAAPLTERGRTRIMVALAFVFTATVVRQHGDGGTPAQVAAGGGREPAGCDCSGGARWVRRKSPRGWSSSG
jgi:MFS family permease